MHNIGITGSSGFVGINLNKYLESKSFKVTSIGRDQLNDIENTELNCDAIIHLAGKAHDLKNASNSNEYYQVNFELTKKLYDAFLKSDAKKFIFISSVKAVADTVENVLTEESVPNPLTHYGKSKLMAEEYIQNQTLPEGKSYYILRPCMIHGPGNKGNLNLLYKFVQKGLPYPLAAFENRRSFLSIENLCYVILNLINRDVFSGVYQVADDEALSTNEVVSVLASSMGKKARLWRVSSTLVKGIAAIGGVFKLPLNTERLKKMTENYIVSNQKIKRTLGINLVLTAREGLKKTADSFS